MTTHGRAWPSVALFAGTLVLLSSSPAAAMTRQFKHRALIITDDSMAAIPEIHVGKRVPTTLAFQVQLKAENVLIADPSGAFPEQAPVSGKNLVLLPGKDLKRGSPATLTVTLADGTVLPFLLKTLPREVDVQIDIVVKLQKQAAPESAEAFKVQLEQARGQLSECESSAESAGIGKIATLIAAQDVDEPELFEKHPAHKLDKQNRLLVEVRSAYRMFKYTYAVLTVENRDPSHPWALDRAEVGVMDGSHKSNVRVESFSIDRPSVGPDETARVVVAFRTPMQTANNRFFVALYEKGGSRHARLEDFSL